MNVALRKPSMTREQFFQWVGAQEERYEFDGFEPVAMVRVTNNHSLICQRIYRALDGRLRDGACTVLGPDAGLATVGDTVRYPDALVTCTKVPGAAYLVPGVIVVFEVISPTSGRNDRIVKLREYRAVPSIRRYVILESRSTGLLVMFHTDADTDWTATALPVEDMPEIGISMPVAEFYDGLDLTYPAMPDA